MVPDLTVDSTPLGGEGERHSPGQDPVHYAPRARLVVLPRAEAIARAGSTNERVALILRGTRRHPGRSAAVVTEDVEAMVTEEGAIRVLPNSAAGFARELFAALHDLDAGGVEIIVVEAPPDDETWLAVRDRLERASRRR